MKIFIRIKRLTYILFVVARYNLDEMLFDLPVLAPLHFLSYLNPWFWLRKKLSRGERIRYALEDLGPIFIKAGQVLSTRRDLLPEDIADELSKLQDQVQPFSGLLARAIIEESLPGKMTDTFVDFEEQALASASIAQVHAATLLDGRPAVIKVLRPGIKKIIDRDTDLLAILAAFAERFCTHGRRFKPKEIAAEITHHLYDELDLMREGANASQLRRNFLGSPSLAVPEIYWQYSSATMLVMERVSGISVNNVQAIIHSGVNMKTLAELGVEIFFTQVFRDGFFHADMHPGNIFVSVEDLKQPQFIVVDFGIMGSLSSKDQRYLADNMLAFFKRDYLRVAELHIASGWLPPNTRVDQFEAAIRAVCEPIFERPLKDISFGQLLLRLFQTARRFQINIQPQLILLQKTLLNIEGLGRQLYPELDIWTTATPYIERWLKKQMGPAAFLRRVRDNLPFWSEKLPEIPGLLYNALQDFHAQAEERRFTPAAIHQNVVNAKITKKRHLLLGLSAGFMVSSGVLLAQTYTFDFVPLLLAGFSFATFILAEIL